MHVTHAIWHATQILSQVISFDAQAVRSHILAEYKVLDTQVRTCMAFLSALFISWAGAQQYTRALTSKYLFAGDEGGE